MKGFSIKAWLVIGALLLCVFLVVILVLRRSPVPPRSRITRVSVASSGIQGNAESVEASISGDGRYVAFLSKATNLVAGDSKGQYAIYVHDRRTGQTARASVASDGTQANAFSCQPAISADGRYTAFESDADNLTAGTSKKSRQVYVHDRETGKTAIVSVASDGTVGNSGSSEASISVDDRYVAFRSFANNLVPNDTNEALDVFVHDRKTGGTIRISVASDGTQGDGVSYSPSISADGRHIAFYSEATNLVPGDTNGAGDVFVHDCKTGRTIRASVSSSGGEGKYESGICGISISGNGRYVAFSAHMNELVPVRGWDGSYWAGHGVFLHDCRTRETTAVSVAPDGRDANGASAWPSISKDGRFVVFLSEANNLAPDSNKEGHGPSRQGISHGPAEVLVRDCRNGQTARMSTARDSNVLGSWAYKPSISADGRYVAFASAVADLVRGDSNRCDDIFVATNPLFPRIR